MENSLFKTKPFSIKLVRIKLKSLTWRSLGGDELTDYGEIEKYSASIDLGAAKRMRLRNMQVQSEKDEQNKHN